MTVCNFFLQGRCRYGEKCWDEHPRGGGGGGGGYGGGGGGYGGYNNRPPPRSGNRGGYGNRVWVNPSQRSSGRDYIQSSTFPKGGDSDWGRGGGEERNNKSSSFSFSTQNRYSTLNTPQGGGSHSQGDDDEKYVETVCRDMESWVSSGQWLFSCYSPLNACLSGFTELSPEELRLEYYTSQASGTLQNYADTVQQLANQWRSRVQELTTLNSATRAALIAELKNPQSASLGFSTTGSVFGAGFGADGSQAAVSTGFGSAASPAGPAGFGSAPSAESFSFSSGSAPAEVSLSGGSAPSAASFSFSSGSAPAAASLSGGSTPTASSFSFSGGSAPAPAPASFSFASSSFGAPSANKDAPAGFGAPASEFSFSAPGFGVSSATPPATGSFGQAVSGAAPTVGGGADQLFTPQGELTSEELKEFAGKRFTLGLVPLKPPPADLLVV
ncbi:nucleoporin NUP42 isoform X2 [Anguilla rostrata]|uniref:nucleoporin NUP42 isoform X1 n=1 Tax=Anguilla rostrata TaxID=7938 RepID=UPI0030CEDAA3